MISVESIEENLKKLVRRNMPEQDRDIIIEDNTDFIDDLEYDSLALMQLLQDIEDEFGVDFTELDNFIDRYNIFCDVVAGIEELLKINSLT